ncbi:MAG TPA: mechanosensitive ion channel family protein [Solirubrobacteraceae bacterium]|nr:mechanosensitive ion channel family protein [Solirubrobacteraceae bacterium]
MSAKEPKPSRRDRFRPPRPDFRFDQMFETHSEAWERVGLAVDIGQRTLRSAQRRAAVMLPLFVAVIVVYDNYQTWFHVGHHSSLVTPIRIAAVLALLGLGWAVARDVGRAAAPTLFKRMDPSTAGTVGFIVRLITVAITLALALDIAGASASSLIAGSAFTAVILGLAAQQTLGNLFAGMVLLSARPFRVGERVRLQAGAVGGQLEGVVSSLGLLYTTFVQGEDRIQVPNNVVLSAAVVPLRQPDPVNVKVTLTTGMSISQVQSILDDRITVPTRRSATVVLEELDGDDVVVRIQATPDRAHDGAQLADEIIGALATVTGQHEPVEDGDGSNGDGSNGDTGRRAREETGPGSRPRLSGGAGPRRD